VTRNSTIVNFINIKKTISIICLALLITTTLSWLGSSAVSAQESTVEQYAPILYFEAEEQCYPIDVAFHLDNSKLYSFDDGVSTLLDDSITSEELANVTDEFFYLDNIHGDLRDAEKIISEYKQQKNDYDITVYYRETNQSGKMIIQYWFFYAYNQGELNVHEGDWEMIQIIFESNIPTQIMYSQHHSGQQVTWNDAEKTGMHPHVYVARGSHANYPRYYSGKLGVASDIVGNNGVMLDSSKYSLVELSDQGWLTYAGRWGEVASIEDTVLGFSGPPGPIYREEGQMWNNPVGWGANLPALNTNLLPLEFLLYNFFTIFIILTLISIGLLSYRLYRRKQTHGFGPRFFSFLYIDGMNQHSIANLLFFAAIIIALIGLTLPWYSVSGSVNSEEFSTDGTIDFLKIDGIDGVQISYPGSYGPIAIGSLILPFSLLIGIGFMFTIFKSIGIKESKRLGRVYLYRGIGLITPFIILIIVIFALGSIISSAVPESTGMNEMNTLFSSLSQSPLAGSESVLLSESGVSSSITLMWGLGLGGYLLLLAGIVLIVSAVLLKMSKKTFY